MTQAGEPAAAHRIRIGAPEDAAALARLQLGTALHAYHEIFPATAPAPQVDDLQVEWERWLRSEGCRVFVADGLEGPIASVACGPDPDEPAVGHMARLYVDPASWGAGIGRALHQACIAHLRAASFERATLWVLEHNSPARRWYERTGWRPTGEVRVVYEPSGIIDLRYRLVLGDDA